MKFPVVFAACLLYAAATQAFEPVIRGDPSQLSAGDLADLRVLAAQLLPANSPVGLIQASGRVAIYAAPVEQTPRLWRGFYFGCDRETKFNRREDGGAAVGSWIAYRYPLWAYAVVAPSGQTLPSFSPGTAELFRPIQISRNLDSDDIVSVCDTIAKSPAIPEKTFLRSPTPPRQIDIAQLPITSVNFHGDGEIRVNLEHGNYNGCAGFWLTLRKSENRWHILDISGFVY